MQNRLKHWRRAAVVGIALLLVAGLSGIKLRGAQAKPPGYTFTPIAFLDHPAPGGGTLSSGRGGRRVGASGRHQVHVVSDFECVKWHETRCAYNKHVEFKPARLVSVKPERVWLVAECDEWENRLAKHSAFAAWRSGNACFMHRTQPVWRIPRGRAALPPQQHCYGDLIAFVRGSE